MRKNRAKHFDEKHYKIAHTKLKTIQQQDILRCFSYDYTAKKASELMGVEIKTINRYYAWMRVVVAESYHSFLRFQQYDMGYELTRLISHSAIATLYWLDIDNAKEWDKHSVLLRGEEKYQSLSTSELMQLKSEDAKDIKRYQEHFDRNYLWIRESFIKCRMRHFRTPMLDNPLHAFETTYRFLIASHVLLHQQIDKDLASEIKGRFIGSDGSLEKVGVIHIDKVFEELFFNRYKETIANIIFTDLMDWCSKNPNA